MKDIDTLERGYRRLLAVYPRAFRRENEEEILAVLLACAPDGLRRPGLATSADLIRSALLMRVRPTVPHSARAVRAAVKVMYLGAVLELAALATIVATEGSVKAAVFRRNPGFTAAQWHSVALHLTIDKAGAVVVAGLWLWLAWANGRGHDWARPVFMSFCCLIGLGIIISLGNDGAVYAPADLIAGGLLLITAITAMALICNKSANRYYQPAAQSAITPR